MHGELGHTQFLPKNILNYGIGGSLDIAANALSSTANFLKAHGWRAGAGYQPGEVNFAALQAWNAAPVYEQAIAVIGRQIEGGEGTSAIPNYRRRASRISGESDTHLRVGSDQEEC